MHHGPDLPLLFHTIKPTVQWEEQCSQPTQTTFVDDTAMPIELEDPDTDEQILEKCFTEIQKYMAAIGLHLNSDKTKSIDPQITFFLNQKQERKDKLFLPTPMEPVKPVKTHRYLGITVSDYLKWNAHLTDDKECMTKQLTRRINALKKIRPYVNDKLMRQIANGIFAYFFF